jgi:hypothetical protein
MLGTRRFLKAAQALIVLLGAASMHAAPPLTLIQDVLYKADGTRFEGVAFIQWKGFQAWDQSTIASQSVTVNITYGDAPNSQNTGQYLRPRPRFAWATFESQGL